jgi:hypothetical protein
MQTIKRVSVEIGEPALMAFVRTDEATARRLVGDGVVLRLEEETPVYLCILLGDSAGPRFLARVGRLKVLEAVPVLEVRPGGVRGRLRWALRANGLIDGDGPPDRSEGVYVRAVLPPGLRRLARFLYESAFIERHPDCTILHAFVSPARAAALARRLDRAGAAYEAVPFRRLDGEA